MANPEHVAKLKEGWRVWNEWRETSDERPDLSGVDLERVSFDYYNLQFVDLSRAQLGWVTFRDARCADCSFEGAWLDQALFHDTDLTRTNFAHSLIWSTTFVSCDFDEAVVTKAQFWRSTFADLSFRRTLGLHTVSSRETSVSIDTFFQSGGLPESLLRGGKVPDDFIEYATSLVGKAIEYYSCFLSYSSIDDEFARRLYNDLQGKNIRTWFAPEDLKIGDRFRSRIDESIRIHDKLVIILSANSVTSDWVETEVESALERERKEGKEVLFPIAIDEEGFSSQQPWAADIRRKRHIGDFRKWKSHDDYTRAFDKLVKDLKKSQPPIIMKGV
jgi:hypothetical protein